MTTHLTPAYRSSLLPLLRRAFVLVLGLSVLGVVCSVGAQELMAVPDAAAQAQAKKLVDEVYAELINAKTDDDKAAAARVLIMRAAETHNAPAAKYVMYDTARSLAVQAGDTDATMDAIDGLAAAFKDPSGGGQGYVDVADASLQDLARKVRSDSQHAAVAQAGLGVAQRMVAMDRLEDASTLLSRLRSSAVRSKRPELTSAYKVMLDELRVIRAEQQRIAEDLKAIKQNPDSPALNLSVGKFLALYRGDWEAGLPMLARSSDGALAAAAKADLAGASGAEAQMAIGEQWWTLAENGGSIEQRRLTERAKHWYRKALPTSQGIERAVLTMRLAPSGQVKWGDLVLEPGIRTMIQADDDAAGAQPGPIAEEASWKFDKKPAGAEKNFTLRFDAYLYSPRPAELGLKMWTHGCSTRVEVNGKYVLGSTGSGTAMVKLIKGYNAFHGSISIWVTDPNKLDLSATAQLNLIGDDGKEIAIPAEHWFHDATR